MDLVGCEVRMFRVRDDETLWWIELENKKQNKIYKLEPINHDQETGDLKHIKVTEVKA